MREDGWPCASPGLRRVGHWWRPRRSAEAEDFPEPVRVGLGQVRGDQVIGLLDQSLQFGGGLSGLQGVQRPDPRQYVRRGQRKAGQGPARPFRAGPPAAIERAEHVGESGDDPGDVDPQIEPCTGRP
jgi:hypothetical protein